MNVGVRTGNSIKNLHTALLLGLVLIVINFVAQRFFVQILGVEYLGLNGLFTNVVAMLAITELGLASAIVYHLYKPLHEKDTAKVSSIMRFYKLSYRLVAAIVTLIGIVTIPILPLIVGDTPVSVNIMLVFALFVVNSVVSYLLSYKRSILYADQKNYIINLVHFATIVVLNVLQIVVLLAMQDYYIFLVLRIAATVIENVILSRIVDKRYALDPHPSQLSVEDRSDIFTKIKGLAFHKVGEFAVLGSTNIIISAMLGLVTVGLYSNYLLIQVTITGLFGQISQSIQASIGNLLVDVGGTKSMTTFRRLQFANQALAIVVVSVFVIVSESFVTLWLGEEYVFTIGVLAALSLNIYLLLIRSAFANFKTAAGIFYEDRYVPLVESAINIVASIILIQFIGLAGAFIGTALSSLALHCYSYPKFVYKGVLGRGYGEYAMLVIKNFAVATGVIAAAYWVSSLLKFETAPGQLISDVAIATIVPCVLLWIIYRNTEEFEYFKKLGGKILRKALRR